MSKLSKANAALDKACKDHGQDPVKVRMAMVSVILTKAAQAKHVQSMENGIAAFFEHDGQAND